MANYLVTGAAGFIGSKVSHLLLSDQNKVIGIDNFNSTLYSPHLKKQRLNFLKNYTNFTFVKGDLLTINLNEILEGVDYVINEAGLPGQLKSWDALNEYFEVNTLATSRLYQASSQKKIKTFIQASTSSVYGGIAVGKEDQKLQPISPYGVSKLAAENLLHAFRPFSQMRTIILRYFSVYGPSQRPDMGIFKFFEQIKNNKPITIYGDGEQTRDFTFISDAARATIQAIHKGKDGEIYNVSGGVQISVNKLLSLIEEVTNVKIKFEFRPKPPGDQIATLADTQKIRKDMNWFSEVDLISGLREQYLWQKEINF